MSENMNNGQDNTAADSTAPLGILPPLQAESDEDLAQMLKSQTRAPRSKWTTGLGALVALVLVFFAGVFVDQHWGPSQSSAGAGSFASIASAFRSGRGSGGLGGGGFGGGGFGGGGFGGGGFGGGITIGTVKLVDGSHIYIADSSGQMVKINTTAATTVSQQQSVKVSDLKAGQTLLIRGQADASGTLVATSITQGSLPGGGFGARAPGGPTGANSSNAASNSGTTSTTNGAQQ